MIQRETTCGTGNGSVIVEVSHVTKTFITLDGHALPVLDGVSFTLREGEIVALLGRSGSGKSTLLRCIAGLIAPSSGSVSYRGSLLNGANPGVAMVKELSGGIRQRVGFARGLVGEPEALLMDEPFSALDVPAAENLRSELTRLWQRHELPTKAIMVVTHNIEEAVLLADRILVLSSNPGRIRAELAVDLPRPRDRHAPLFETLVDTVYGILTGREEPAVAADAFRASGRPRRNR